MYLNLAPRHESRYVYRITSIERLKELFTTNRNTFVKPALWDDPFENFILKSKVRHKPGEVREYNYHDRLYGQCWTLHKASDAMWRIYAPDKRGIRLRSTIHDLAGALLGAHPSIREVLCRIGRVQYLPNKKMRAFADHTFDESGIAVDKLFNSLLVKRPAFKHEREVRLLYFEMDDEIMDKDTYSYSVDPHSMISQIMIDPRLTVKEAQLLRDEIRDVTKYEGTIKRSLLYAPPRGKIVNVTDELLP